VAGSWQTKSIGAVSRSMPQSAARSGGVGTQRINPTKKGAPSSPIHLSPQTHISRQCEQSRRIDQEGLSQPRDEQGFLMTKSKCLRSWRDVPEVAGNSNTIANKPGENEVGKHRVDRHFIELVRKLRTFRTGSIYR